MRAFSCDRCGQLLFFENSLCLRCGSHQGLVPSRLALIVVDESTPRCANFTLAQCNWLVEENGTEHCCRSCRLTRTRPGDDDAESLAVFAHAETAKRRLIYQLLDLRLPIEPDLAFDLLSSRSQPVVTGHENGVITIDLAESDDVRREQRRAELGEPYRTMLGHFRHEIGHYYWPILIERTGRLDAWRTLFGDERIDYQEALDRHYEQGPPRDWSEHHVSAYATMHPWEDWAETFAHYLHIRDTLETAAAFRLVVAGPPEVPSLTATPGRHQARRSFNDLLGDWLPLTYVLNALNRSLGRDDLYPFTLAPEVVEKLSHVHDLVAPLV